MSTVQQTSQGGSSSPTSSHGAIFRASFFTGGAQVASSMASMARMKLVALILGVAGVGANGLLFQAASLVQTSLGFGISSSGVRAVAAAHGAGDDLRLSQTVRALRVWVWATGLLCLLFCAGLSRQLSFLTFGNEDHALDFVILGFAALLQQISAGQAAVLRGLRRIKELARMNIAAALASLVLAGPCFWLFGIHGIAVSFLGASAMSLFFSWLLTRRERLVPAQLTLGDVLSEGRELFAAGIAFVGTALAGAMASYLNALVVRHSLGLDGNGLYQAGMGITVVLVGFVLSAMGQDYYPKLVALLQGGEDVSGHIHDQVDMALLMSLPLLVGVSAMAPWALHAVYSEKFVVAAPLVTWLAAGSLARIASWPLGYALLAEGNIVIVLLLEFGAALFGVAFAWFGVQFAEVEGAAIAFAAHGFLYWIVAMFLVARRFGFRMQIWLYGHILAGVLAVYAGRWTGPILGAALTVLVSAICLRAILRRLGPNHRLSAWVSKVPVLRRLANSP